MQNAITNIKISSLKHISTGKVREIYEIDKESLLMVATDRLSAFDVVFKNGIPLKGFVLNKLSSFWFKKMNFQNHFITENLDSLSIKDEEKNILKGRSMIIKRTSPLPVESVVRGYLMGSAYKSYQETGKVFGIELPDGLKKGDKLPEPIFTPTTKAKEGHDLPLNKNELINLIGEKLASEVEKTSLELFNWASDYLINQGIILADTKFEFGILNNNLILIDEVLTPDSSRFWNAEEYSPGKDVQSMDKQYIRNYLLSIGWSGEGSPPLLPDEIVNTSSKIYLEIYKKITKEELIL